MSNFNDDVRKEYVLQMLGGDNDHHSNLVSLMDSHMITWLIIKAYAEPMPQLVNPRPHSVFRVDTDIYLTELGKIWLGITDTEPDAEDDKQWRTRHTKIINGVAKTGDWKPMGDDTQSVDTDELARKQHIELKELNAETEALRERIAALEAERDTLQARNNELESVIDIAHDMTINLYDMSDHDSAEHNAIFNLRSFLESKLPD